MNSKDTLKYLRLIEIGKSKELPDTVIKSLVDRDFIEILYIGDVPAYNGNHVLTDEGLELVANNR
jgi:hypothetical protein